MKVSELEGRILDYEVWKIDGYVEGIKHLPDMPEYYSPSTNWDQGGPIIEREKMWITFDNNNEHWDAAIAVSFKETPYGRALSYKHGSAPTPLIAAMRAYVSTKYGDEVD